MKAITAAVIMLCGMLLATAAMRQVTHNLQQGESSARLNLSAAEIAELVNETGRQTTMMTARMADYTYTAESIKRECDRHGAVKQETVKVYEAYPAFGRQSVRLLISENGVARAPEQLNLERKRAVSELVEAEKRAAKAHERQDARVWQPSGQDFRSYGVSAGRGGGKPYKIYIRPTDFLLSHEFFAPRQSLFNGRAAVVLGFRPRAGMPASDDSGRVRMRLAGRVWIDAAEKVIMRLEALPLRRRVSRRFVRRRTSRT